MATIIKHSLVKNKEDCSYIFEAVIEEKTRKERFSIFRSDDAVEFLKREYNFVVQKIIKSSAISNMEAVRKGNWIVEGYFDVPKKDTLPCEEEALIDTKEEKIITSVASGLSEEQVKNISREEKKNIKKQKK